VLVLANARSGLRWGFDALRPVLDRCWDVPGTELTYQFCQSVEDGVRKASRAAEQGVDVVLVMGGDGSVSTIGGVLVGTPVVLGMIPCGSGNGFARHFEVPLSPAKAVEALARARVKEIDVGLVNRRPFLVTCSMAWDASIADTFARSPVRGILPYVFAGVQGLFEYQPQDIRVVIDDVEEVRFTAPLVFTVANLSEYGGGARIAPRAREDDGQLELVVALRQDLPRLLAGIPRLFDGSLHEMPEVVSRPFRTLKVIRERAAPIQIDGDVSVRPRALRVLVP
jgi:diacylglycerol kinase family enzyme